MACHSPWHESGMEEHDRDKPLGYTVMARDAQPVAWPAASKKGWENGISAHSLMCVPAHIPPGPYPIEGCKRHLGKDFPVFGLAYSFLLKKVAGRRDLSCFCSLPPSTPNHALAFSFCRKEKKIPNQWKMSDSEPQFWSVCQFSPSFHHVIQRKI